jgi:HSP20 family molecular chaperone IbpA
MALPTILDEIDRLFDELVSRPWGKPRLLEPARFRAVEDGWIIELPAEGLHAKDLGVSVRGRQLTVSGQRHREQERRVGTTGWRRSEHDIAWHRSVMLPPDADPDSIEARIEDSTLILHIRRRQP